MAIYITVDGGTTNTRVQLVKDYILIDTLKLPVGAKNGKEALIPELKGAIEKILSDNSLSQKDVKCIIASGMITSEYGLCNLPHVTAPAGKAELRASIAEAEFQGISALKWYFIRGVKTVSDTLSGVDMMRGEETELMGIAKDGEDALYVMPGTHSKHVSIDKDGRIVSFKTMMTGELFAAVSSGTILKDAIDGASGDPIPEKLKFGYEYCRDKGLNEALFKTRILKNLFGASPLECYSFLIGALLCDEILPIISAPEKKIIITGQKQLRHAIAYLIEDSGKEITVLDDDTVASSTAIGAVRIFESDIR